MTDRHLQNYLNGLNFHLLRLNINCALPYPCYFYALVLPFGAKNHMICIFAVILIRLLPLDHAVDKMSVGHANEN